MTIINTVESERLMVGGSVNPVELRQRMLTSDDEISDDDLLQALRALDPDALKQALQDFDDDEIRFLSNLMEQEN